MHHLRFADNIIIYANTKKTNWDAKDKLTSSKSVGLELNFWSKYITNQNENEEATIMEDGDIQKVV